MRILCLNGWGGRLHDRLVPYIREVDPDVLCLQEVVHTPSAEKPWLLYRDDGAELPQRANFYSDIRDALPQHSAFFAPAALGSLWDGVPAPGLLSGYSIRHLLLRLRSLICMACGTLMANRIILPGWHRPAN